MISTKPLVKKKLKELLSEIETFKVQSVLVLEYKKKNYHKIFNSSAKLKLVIQALMKHLNPCIKALWQK